MPSRGASRIKNGLPKQFWSAVSISNRIVLASTTVSVHIIWAPRIKKGSRNGLARLNYIPQMCIGQYSFIGTHQIGISHLGVRHARKLNPKTILEQLTYVFCWCMQVCVCHLKPHQEENMGANTTLGCLQYDQHKVVLASTTLYYISYSSLTSGSTPRITNGPQNHFGTHQL